MTGAILILLGLVVIGVILYFADRHTTPAEPQPAEQKATEQQEPSQQPEEECCGQHLVCEKTSLSPGLSDKAEYFDDEELDRFRGRSPQSYSSEEIEEFRDVLLTLRPEEVAAWGRAVQIRAIPLPDVIRDELLMIVSEARQ